MKLILSACLILIFTVPASAEPERLGPVTAQPEPKRLRFEFRDTRWRDVLEWLGQQAGLPVVGSMPAGVFNFTPPAGKSYTVPEMICILNEALFDSHRKLVVRPRNIAVVPINDELAETKPVVELIPVANLDAVKAARTLKAMFAEMRGLFVEADSARSAVIVRATREQMLEIKAALSTLEAGVAGAPNVKTLTLPTGSAADLAEELARSLRALRPNTPVRVVGPGKELPKDAPKDKGLTILAAGDRVIFHGEDTQALALAHEVARLYATAKAEEGDHVVIKLKSADAVATARVLDEIFNGPRASSRAAERIRIVAHPESNALLVRASPVDLLTIRRLLQTHLDADETDSQAALRTFLVGPLKHASAAELVKVVREVFASERSRGFTATADARTNTIVLRGTRPLFDDVKRLVEQLDVAVEPKK